MIQHLTELLFTDCEDYLHLIMQYLLVNFYIWSRPALTVRIGQQLDHTYTLMHSVTHTHSHAHSFTHSFTHTHTHTPFTYSLTHSLTHIHSFKPFLCHSLISISH